MANITFTIPSVLNQSGGEKKTEYNRRIYYPEIEEAIKKTEHFKSIDKKEQGKFIRDRLILHIPIVGKIIKNTLIARFCRTLGTLLESGVSLLESLNIVANISGNKVFEKAIIIPKTTNIKSLKYQPFIPYAGG